MQSTQQLVLRNVLVIIKEFPVLMHVIVLLLVMKPYLFLVLMSVMLLVLMTTSQEFLILLLVLVILVMNMDLRTQQDVI